jgi:NAD(P)-dependent dehydrogenase (short-subunit alcohol dehydrogenase family)
MNLSGQTAVFIGGASGLGFAAARAAQAEGASVIVTSIAQEQIDEATAALGNGAQGFLVDVTSESAVAKFYEKVGHFDHLVLTVGDPLRRVAFIEQPIADARRNFEIRFWGQYTAAKLAASRIGARGSITFTTGLAGRRATPGIVALGAVCGAIESLAYGLAVELAPVRVNAVCPGVVDTGIWNAIDPKARGEFLAAAGAGLPVGRVGKPEDLAESYLYLMKNGYATGTVVVSDGGGSILSH